MQKEINFNFKNVFLVFLFASAIWFLTKIPITLTIFAISLILFLIFDPIIQLLQKIYNNRMMWVLVVFTLLLIILVFSFYLLVPLLLVQLQHFVQNVNLYINWIAERVQFLSDMAKQNINVEQFNKQLDNSASQINSWLINSINTASSMVFSLFSNIFNFVFAVIISIYMLIDKDRIKDSILKILPTRVREHEQKLLPKVMGNLTAYIRGIILLVFIVFIISWPVLSLMKVQYSFLFSVWAGISIIIPYIGPFVGTIPPVVASWFQSPSLGIEVLVFLSLLQFVVAYVLTPKIMEKSLNIHPLWVLFAITAGGELFGIVGMIIGVPVAAIIITIYRYYRDNF